ncbi:hypothetical protein AB0G32_14405 [Streptomyces sp. NPDC023723]|uniref:hypothetical protein n=1 Tax=Streptomyces sp. NPDC023723 TaxID=3154323 RepID=UPI0033EAE951
MPVPTDPRTPLQRVTDQLAAANRKLTGPSLPRSERAALARRTQELEREIGRLTGPVTRTRFAD